ncbi:hypothetical protein [Citrobacter braakii]|uniref:hypothetical protein n=1 Tax=Citrobacter braakii TaxID=57706 RepID=UPI0024321F2D|nr:hypothetical protein [Citrobacter braakii]WFX95801.1 hypothetical protein NFK19_03020 [Citrobacter braakii]WFY04845.1 hypothetical protein NFK21_03020 [Citrobacter braakii]
MFNYLLKRKNVNFVEGFSFCEFTSYPNIVFIGINESEVLRRQIRPLLCKDIKDIRVIYENGFLKIIYKTEVYYFWAKEFIEANKSKTINGYLDVGFILLTNTNELKSTQCEIFSVKLNEDNCKGNLLFKILPKRKKP